MPVISIAVGYLVGSIPFAWLLARWLGTADLHRVGSGNIGAANVLRASGVKAGILVAALDIAKGAASVWLAERLNADSTTAALAGLAAVAGHVYPVWLRFRGGKGVAAACGVFAMLTPLALLPAAGVFLLGAWLTKYISVGSVLGSAVLPPLAYVMGNPVATVYAAGAAATLIVFRHRSNLTRVWLGTERRVGARV